VERDRGRADARGRWRRALPPLILVVTPQTEQLARSKWSRRSWPRTIALEFVDVFSNPQRDASYLGNPSPTEFERRWQAQTASVHDTGPESQLKAGHSRVHRRWTRHQVPTNQPSQLRSLTNHVFAVNLVVLCREDVRRVSNWFVSVDIGWEQPAVPIPLPHRLVQGAFHRALRHGRRVVWSRVTELVFGVLAAVGPLWITLSGLTEESRLFGIFLLVALFVAGGLRVLVAAREIREAERVRRKVIENVLGKLHKEVFHDSPDFRLTLFVKDSAADVIVRSRNGQVRREKMLIPYARRQANGLDPTCTKTRIYYPEQCKSVTATAWRRCSAAPNDFREGQWGAYIYSFPEFSSREMMVDYYVNTLGIDSGIVNRLSDHMISVRWILSLPLLNYDGRGFFALLSVDSTADLRQRRENDSEADVTRDGRQVVDIKMPILERYLDGARSVLSGIEL
jgi:hypothetical protein